MLIKSLSLKDFKCFEQVDIDFGKITLLTGANSSGKSSLIYALLGIMQSKYFPQYFALNGELINMGGFDEVLRKKAEKREFEINLSLHSEWKIHNYKTTWIQNDLNEQPKLKELTVDWFSLKDISDDSAIFEEIYSKKEFDSNELHFSDKNRYKIIHKNEDEIIIHHNKRVSVKEEILDREACAYFMDLSDEPYFFNYIGSFRLPPERTYYQKPKASKINVNGEGYIDQIIEWEEYYKENYKKLLEAISEIGLFHSIQANKMKGGRFELNVQVNENSELASLTDVGFGISQFLPIIVADLQMEYDSCLAISQPEIHLHPKIQATLGDYFCKQVNNTDKQYIVETHSEYLINRMRLLIVKGELKPEDVKLYYMENDGVKTTTYAIELTTDGQIKNAPQGFFDTYEMDVMDIALYASA
jgi:predicted ATPase